MMRTLIARTSIVPSRLSRIPDCGGLVWLFLMVSGGMEDGGMDGDFGRWIDG